ncbi:DUF1802 family protein [Longimicrobium terrae]|uniref:DUF1802 family protein n=1 Tax=Longimicrobium terrae TaxID=1639882 RepID=A0A841H3Z7_9BACT|nr:DUF1802 family protein [Longimicrobium terrae]MBB4638306.1 hypothetical protein [Longimicrobium terrae]MBB6072626.1 hypothetical protein [Longimicrobium terrae]NNC28595.1 DUF1802 family protein [Longimicrobium terrae]
METSNRSALKEWSVVDEALAAGRLSLLVRKGGIHEKTGEFGVDHREFWIFPTGWHQNPADLAEEFHPLLSGTGPESRDRIPFRVYCVVEDVWRIATPEALDRIQGLHPLAPPAAHARFAYRGKPFVHAMLVRAYRLSEPVALPDLNRYEGCVSWVELEQALPTHELLPVMADSAFDAVRREIEARLGTDGVVRL